MKIFCLSNVTFHYFGQCNHLRLTPAGETKWQEMIKQHQKISIEEMQANCALTELLDDQTLEEFMADDPTSYCAKSKWGEQPCYYVMEAGFEFIFV